MNLWTDKYTIMPKLSLWRTEKSADYKFIDRTISEQFTIGATDLYIHKYLGTNNPTGSVDKTLPVYDKIDPTNIQDLLFLENRDRKYSENIYRVRGHYNVQNLDFNLSQFGLFLNNDIIFVTVHYNDMIDVIGRKLMVGDVFELPHLTDYHPLNETIPIGLRRYYQVTDANFASEGFSPTWYPHLWRIKCEPLVNTQEFSSILSKPTQQDNYLGDWEQSKQYPSGYTVTYNGKIYIASADVPMGVLPTDTNYWTLSSEHTIVDIISRYNQNIQINNAALEEAARNVPKTGYDTSQLYVVPAFEDGKPANPVDIVFNNEIAAPNTTLEVFTNPDYKLKSTALRVGRTSSVIESLNLTLGTAAVISVVQTAPILTENGSGPVAGEPALVVSTIGRITSPFGTTDNTFIHTDNQALMIVTAYSTQPKVTRISLVEIPGELKTGMTLRSTVFSDQGLPTQIFEESTIITSIDLLGKSIQISAPTNGALPEGHPIEISFSFDSEPTTSDFRADSDPRFSFIKRFTPTSFGYLAGYMTGDGTAPNGEPVGSGTSFPANPRTGDYFLRLDYSPQRLFRWDGRIWVAISSKVRTEPGMTMNDKSLRSSFFNNTETINNVLGEPVSGRQSLSKALKIKPD